MEDKKIVKLILVCDECAKKLPEDVGDYNCPAICGCCNKVFDCEDPTFAKEGELWRVKSFKKVESKTESKELIPIRRE